MYHLLYFRGSWVDRRGELLGSLSDRSGRLMLRWWRGLRKGPIMSNSSWGVQVLCFRRFRCIWKDYKEEKEDMRIGNKNILLERDS